MITGFNTDIEFDGITYHVQTEDKGLDNPLILSLVYVGGAILASKRSPYTDLLNSGFDENVLTERLNRQHKLICAAVRSGRIDDLKRMSEKDLPAAPRRAAKPEAETVEKPASARDKKAATDKKAAPAPVETKASIRVEANPSVPVETKKPPPVEAKAPIRVEAKPPNPVETRPSVPVDAKPSAAVETKPSILDLVTDYNVPIVPEGITVQTPPLPPPPPPATTELPPTHLKREVLHQAPEKAAEDGVVAADESQELYLALLDDEGDFRAGELVTVRIRVGRGRYGHVPIPEASVTVKVLGTTFRPLILSTLTDDNGIAVVRALLPRFTSGRAAILIRAVVEGEDAELRRIIHQA